MRYAFARMSGVIQLTVEFVVTLHIRGDNPAVGAQLVADSVFGSGQTLAWAPYAFTFARLCCFRLC